MYVHELKKTLPVDVYGACGNKHCPRNDVRRCLEMLSRDYINIVFILRPLMNIGNGDVFLCCLPFFHIYAIVVMLTSLASGAKVVIMARCQQTEFLENKYKVCLTTFVISY